MKFNRGFGSKFLLYGPIDTVKLWWRDLTSPLNFRERFTLYTLFSFVLLAFFSPGLVAKSGDEGKIFSVASSSCTSESWQNFNLAQGQPSDDSLTTQNAASSPVQASSIICSNYSTADQDHTVDQKYLNINFQIVDNLPNADNLLDVIVSPDAPVELTELPVAGIADNESVLESFANIIIKDANSDWVELTSISQNQSGPISIEIPENIDINSLEVKLEIVNDNQGQFILLDAINVIYQVAENLELELLINDNNDLVTINTNKVELDLKIKNKSKNIFEGLFNAAKNQVTSTDNTSANLIIKNSQNEIVTAQTISLETKSYDPINNRLLTSELELNKANIEPGRYTLELNMIESDGNQVNYQQDFLWGVLALNTDFDVYKVDQSALLQIAVLDENGASVCDAELNLEITGPENKSYGNAEINQTESCSVYGPQIDPDYFVSTSFSKAGTYKLNLSATTDNGSYEVSNQLVVEEKALLQFERTGPTRVYPVLDYPMTINIKSESPIIGELVERVPNLFEIEQLEFTNPYKEIRQAGDYKEIVWDGNGKNEMTIGYRFDAPDIDPEFYLLGPISINDIAQEQRSWQIANDGPTDDFRIQEGTTTITGTTATITAGSEYIAPADVSKSFIRITGTRNTGVGNNTGGGNQDADDFTVKIDNPSNLGTSITFSRAGATGNTRVSWEIIEYQGFSAGTNEIVVRDRGNLTVNSGNATIDTSTISGIADDNDVTVWITGWSSQDTGRGNLDAGRFTAEWIGASDIARFTRNGTGATVELSYAIVEFVGSNWTVERSENTFTGTAVETQTITTLPSLAQGFLLSQFRTDGSGLDDNGAMVWLSTASEVSYQVEDASGSKTAAAWVIANSQSNGTPLNVEHGSFTRNGGSEPDVSTVTINTVTDLTTSSLTLNARSTGGGTAYPRGYISQRFNSASEIELWTSDNGQTQNGRYQVIQWPTEVPSGVAVTKLLNYRWRDDNHDLDTNNGWLAAENTQLQDVEKGAISRLRVRVANTGDSTQSGAIAYELQFATRLAGESCYDISGWTGVDDTSDEISTTDTTHISPDGESSVSSLLSNTEAYTYIGGEGRDQSDTTSALGPLDQDEYLEIEYSISVNQDAVTGSIYCLRVYDTTNSETLAEYVNFPEFKLTAESVSITVGESGTTTAPADGAWQTINFFGTYNSPVVVGTSNSHNGQNALVFEARNVSSTSAEVRLCESEGSTSNGCDTHAPETIGYLVIDASASDQVDGLEAGSFTVSGQSDSSTVSPNYSETFVSTPYVFANVNSVNSTQSPTEVVITATSSASFTAGICDHAQGAGNNDNCDGSHPNETVGWVAIDPNTFTTDLQYDAGLVVSTSSNWQTVNFSSSFAAIPALIAASQTDNGTQDVEIDEGRNVSVSAADIRYCEIDTLDNCDSHASDDLAWLAIEQGDLSSSFDFSQDNYQFFANADSTEPGAQLENENTEASNISQGTIVRLRMSAQVGDTDLPANSIDFKLQYGVTTGECTAVASWNDVGGPASTTAWRGYDNSTPSDGANITTSLINGGANVLQSYTESGQAPLNPNQINSGERGEWDFVIENYAASGDSTYCFRMVSSDGSEISYYRYPALSTALPANMMVLYDGASIPSGWSCVSCISGDDFFERFIRGNSSYGSTGGSLTHSHTYSGVAISGPSTTDGRTNGGTPTISQDGHAHGNTININAATNLPQYRDLKIIKFDAGGEPGVLPAGTIAFFPINPGGDWTTYTAQVGSYVRGAGNVGSVSGANTHANPVSGTLDAAGAPNTAVQNGGQQEAVASNGHTHSVVGSVNSANHEPPYHEYIVARTSVSTTTPQDIIAIWDDNAPPQWNCLSCSGGDPLFEAFVKPANTSGASGGSATHNHTDSNITSGLPSTTTTTRNGNANAADDHTHDVTIQGVSTENHLPPYIDVIFAQKGTAVGNSAPNAPTSLTQEKLDTSTISTGGWTNESSIILGATVSDTDNPEDLQLCVEVKPIGTGFSFNDSACSSSQSYSGTPLDLTVTVAGLVDGSDYHWQARVKDDSGDYSAWVSYGGNPESEADYRVDQSPPSGIVRDGPTAGVDEDYNDGSLDTLSGNWTIDSASSGLAAQDYSIGTSPGDTSIVGWTTASGSTFTETGLNLNTSEMYFVNIRTDDNAGNQSTISSDGIFISPTLSLNSAPSAVAFGTLESSNSYESNVDIDLTTSTNAYNGYEIRAWIESPLTSGANTIPNFSLGTWASPAAWSGSLGYGYTSDDTSVAGSDRFNSTPCSGGGSPPCYAPFSVGGPGDIVADHTSQVSGTPIVGETFTITHRVKSDPDQNAGRYTTTVIYSIRALY